MSKLNVGKIKALSLPGLYGDGGTLYLNIAKAGSKSWIQRIAINGKRHDIGLGPWPLVSLREAREKAFANRKIVYDGGDPLAAKRKARMPTFREAAQAVFEAKKPSFRNLKAEKNWWQQMEKHVYPKIGALRVDRIDRSDVLRVLTPIWTTRTDTARKLRQRIKAVLAWAEAHGYIEQNVAGDAISGALPTMPSVKEHLRALPYAEVADALATVEATGASPNSKLCFRFTVLTAARSGEARGARWDEIDMDARLWCIPAGRMKAKSEHRVPLSDAALAVIEEAKALDDGSGLVFPSAVHAGKEMSDMTLTKLLRTTGLAARTTVHGFRSSFRDWCAETGKPREIAEAALAHVVGGVEGAYFRSDLFERRHALMEQWAAYVTGVESKVVRLRV